jgi:hypothetical protein
MSHHFLVGALGVAAASLGGASAAAQTLPGHFEWRSTVPPGPRAPLTAPRRVWIDNRPSDQGQPSTPKSAAGVSSSAGHYVWKPSPEWGPRSPARAPVRVWVADKPENARDVRHPA